MAALCARSASITSERVMPVRKSARHRTTNNAYTVIILWCDRAARRSSQQQHRSRIIAWPSVPGMRHHTRSHRLWPGYERIRARNLNRKEFSRWSGSRLQNQRNFESWKFDQNYVANRPRMVPTCTYRPSCNEIYGSERRPLRVYSTFPRPIGGNERATPHVFWQPDKY